ncbi:MAG: type II toxin-antitoxin system Phd/YefM family antitoxin [Acidimicrobiales bacterium]
MNDIPARELRNDVSQVLRRVQDGERLRVTISGRPVAQLLPLPARPSTMAWGEFQRSLVGARADSELAAELAELLPETTDDLAIS